MRIAAVVLSVIAVAGCGQSSIAQGQDTSFAALAKLPDWSGVWLPDLADQDAQIRTNPVPWKPAVAAKIKQLEEQERAGHPKPLFANCLPEAMPSWMLISHNAVEILFTPGRVTMLGESDGNRLRRIYTDGRSHPADPDPSFHGHSIGHWEGDTLVVETKNFIDDEHHWVDQGVPASGELKIIERIRLINGGKQLEIAMTLTDPKNWEGEWKGVRRWNRVNDIDIEEVECRPDLNEHLQSTSSKVQVR